MTTVKMMRSAERKSKSKADSGGNGTCSCSGVKKKMGFSCGKDKDGYYVFTHRARSKSYASLGEIPLKALKWVDSTG